MSRMKRALCASLLMSVAAVAANTAGASDYNWNGFYFGINAGGAWGSGDIDTVGDDPTNGGGNRLLNSVFGGISSGAPASYVVPLDMDGFTAGVTVGHNWRLGSSLMAGVEADIQHSALEEGFLGDDANPHAMILAETRELEWFGTLRARVGVLLSEHVNVYATGGLAFGGTEQSMSISRSGAFADLNTLGNTPLTCVSGEICIADSASSTSTGWALGGGVEFTIGDRTTIRAEYLHLDLGSEKLRLVAQAPSTGTGFATADFENTYDVVRVGITFKF